MEIASKPIEDITEDEREFLRESYTSMGGLLPKGFNGGAFFTPTHVTKFIWDVLRDRLPTSPRILEPSVGSGVFLEHAPDDAEITALELDETSAKVTSVLYPDANVIQGDALLHDRHDYYDVVIGNPPFGEAIAVPAEEAPHLADWQTLTKRKKNGQHVYGAKSEAAFIELAVRSAKPGGYIAFVLPKGIAFNSQSAKVRKLLYDTCWHLATVMLPGETFQHVGTTIETQILIVRKATPNAKKIPAVTKRWGSNFCRSDFGDLAGHTAEYFEGQPPAYFAKVTDIGWDDKGRNTDKWGDGQTQLDELTDDFTDGGLMRENLYPHVPSWHGVDKGAEAFMFSHGNDLCDGHRDAQATFADGPYRWNELTLGAGEEVACTATGAEWSTFDLSWQDAIVAEYERKKADL